MKINFLVETVVLVCVDLKSRRKGKKKMLCKHGDTEGINQIKEKRDQVKIKTYKKEKKKDYKRADFNKLLRQRRMRDT